MADPAISGPLFGLAAAGMTLIGTLGAVIATNWGSSKRLNIQLKHDSDEKAKERLVSTRSELYLKAVDANMRALAYFGTLPQADFTKPDADIPIRNMLAIGAQLQLVVGQGTAQLLSDVVSAFGELQLELIAKVMPMHGLRSGITIQSSLEDNAQAEVRRVVALMTQFVESGQRDAAQLERFNRSYEFARDTAARAADERAALWDQLNVLNRQYMKEMVPEVKRLGELQMLLLVELRNELDVGGDIEVFRRIMRKQIERAERAVEKFDRDGLGGDE